MPAPFPSLDSFRFGPFLVDAPAGQLYKRSARIRLAGQPFEILVMLLERPGQVVTREEIQHRLWPQEKFLDFENSLNKSINKLRQALSDSADHPLYVETLPRRGYRFIGTLLPPPAEHLAQLHIGPRSATAPAPPAPVPLPRPSGRLSRVSFFWRVASASILMPLGFLLWLTLRPFPPPYVLGVTPLTSFSRVDLYGGLHSDGVRLYFLVRRGHKWELSQMPVAGGEIQPISLPFANARLWSISPDGSQFALGSFQSRTSLLPISIMSSVGGTSRRLGDIFANDAIFSHDGARITYTTAEGIFEADIDGSKTKKLADLPGQKWSLAWSPDGQRLRFHWLSNSSGPFRIWEVRADGSNLHQPFSDWNVSDNLCCGRWTADGKYFLFLAFSSLGPSSIWAVRESSGWFHSRATPVRLSTGPISVSLLMPSTDSKHIFFLGNNTRAGYVRADSSTKEIRSLIGGQPAAWATFAPSGNWVVFRGENNALWRSNPNGSSRVELISGKFDPGMPAFRPDEKLIAFRGRPVGSPTSSIFVVSPDGGEAKEFASANFPLEVPAWSPDGEYLSYVLDAEKDPSSGIYVVNFETGISQKIPGSEKCMQHSWSPDGKFLACVSTDISRILLYNWYTKSWKQVAEGKVFSPVLWASDSTALFFQDILEEGEPIRRLRIKDLSVERVFDCSALLEGDVQRCGFEGIAPNGQFLLKLSRGDHDVYSMDVDLP